MFAYYTFTSFTHTHIDRHAGQQTPTPLPPPPLTPTLNRQFHSQSHKMKSEIIQYWNRPQKCPGLELFNSLFFSFCYPVPGDSIVRVANINADNFIVPRKNINFSRIVRLKWQRWGGTQTMQCFLHYFMVFLSLFFGSVVCWSVSLYQCTRFVMKSF